MSHDDDSPDRPGFDPDPDPDAGTRLFFADCPDPQREPCLAQAHVDGVLYLYFEDVQTTATLRLGIPQVMRYLQVVLVLGADGMPRRMIRLERSIFGTQCLCVLERDGRHLNFGPAERTDAETFLTRAVELDRALSEGRSVH